MAKNIMVSNKVYEELKRIKGKDKSFSDVIAEALEARPKKKLGAALKEVAGILEGDTEYDEAFKWLRKMQKITDDKLWKELR